MGYSQRMPPSHVGRLVIDVVTEDAVEMDYSKLLTDADKKQLAAHAAQLFLTKEDTDLRIKEIGIDLHSHYTGGGNCDHCGLNQDETWTNLQ